MHTAEEIQAREAVEQAPLGVLVVQLIKNSMRKSNLIERVLALDVDATSKVALIGSMGSAQDIDGAERIVAQMESNPTIGSVLHVMERVRWEELENVLTRQFESSSGVTSLESTPEKESWVYFIESKTSGLIKIGRSINPDQRFASIRTMSPDELTLLRTIPEAEVTEAELHKRFAHLRKHGEWFEDGPEIRNFVTTFELANA